ncbi:MAG TPA: 6,7-dimethyl-8-ribityllumazine synthase [bacterium]
MTTPAWLTRKRFALVASEFHRPITQVLIRGAERALLRHGVPPGAIERYWVPGAFELPVAAARLAASSRRRPSAIIALGVLVRGQTRQHEVLAQAVAQGLEQIAIQRLLPVTSGVVLAESLAQARARAGGREGNRGAEAALAALAVLRVFATITGRRSAAARRRRRR